jgi:very-short-patch-repair endonuclease
MRNGQKTAAARRLRANPTEAEKRLWRKLRMQQIRNARFRRQVPVGPFVVDFACIDRRLVIELDGGQHGLQIEADKRRTAWFSGRSWLVLRFWNNEVFKNMDGILDRIASALTDGGCPHPVPPPQAGEGAPEEKR